MAVCLVILVGLLAYRGYGVRYGVRPTEAVSTARVDLNNAERTELAQIPSVGPKLAEAIEGHRQKNGPFRSVDDLREVKGVGAATLDKVRPYVRVESVAVVPSAEIDPTIPERKRPPVTVTSFKPDTPAPAPAERAPAGSRKLQPGDPPVNVNTATAEDLQRVPGVGPVTAQNIVAARAVQPFRSVSDLDRVRGIGVKTVEKIRPFVVVE